MDEKMFDLLSKLYNEVQEMKGDMATKDDIKAVKQDIKAVKQDIVRLENKMDDKLTALFDGHKQHTDKLDSTAQDVAEIKEELLTVETLALSTRSDILRLKKNKNIFN